MVEMIPILGSIETLLADVKNVRSDMSLKQLAHLIDEEFRSDLDSQHMESSHSTQRHKAKKGDYSIKYKVCSVVLTSVKWITGFIFVFLLALALFPDKTLESLDSLQTTLSIKDKNPEYNSSSISWYFYCLQIIRLSSTNLGLEKKFPVTDHIIGESCIINNPLYKLDRLRCSVCKGVTGFEYHKIQNKDIIQPLVLKNQDVSFNMGRLQQVLRKEAVMLNQHTVSILSNVDYIHRLEDLKNNSVLERLEHDNMAHIAGASLSYMSSHILRKEFRHPNDYLTNVAQTYKTFFYIDGKHSPAFTLRSTVLKDSFSNFMYVQCSGKRRLVFSPPDYCQHKCQTFSRVMEARDIVFYSSLWNVESQPTNDKSLAYMDNFEWMIYP